MPLPALQGEGHLGIQETTNSQHLSAGLHASLQNSRVLRPTKEENRTLEFNKMATQEDFVKDVRQNMDVLRHNFPDLLSSLDQQQQLRRLVNDRKSEAFLCAVVMLMGDQPEGYAACSDGTTLSIVALT